MSNERGMANPEPHGQTSPYSGDMQGHKHRGYQVKDSGKRMHFDSGMQRDTQDGKVRYDLVYDGPMLHRWAEHLTKGAQKYDARNWMKASGTAEAERFKASAARHFAQWMNGDTDEDHAAAVVFNINGYEHVRIKKLEAKVFSTQFELDLGDA